MSKDDRPQWQRQGLDPRDPYFKPTYVGMQAAVDKFAEDGVPMTISRIKRATESSELSYSILSGKRAYSGHDLDQWLLTLRRSADAAASA
ncbi:hypothetical protein BH09ACT7_BH09ACT7_16120 [soil metagenome]